MQLNGKGVTRNSPSLHQLSFSIPIVAQPANALADLAELTARLDSVVGLVRAIARPHQELVHIDGVGRLARTQTPTNESTCNIRRWAATARMPNHTMR
eukprot:8936028-Alexandrium_andersonii.AAC.1